MTDDERIKILQSASDHRFDLDENADFAVDSDDPILRAAAAWFNKFGEYGEILLAPGQEVLDAIRLARQ
jgi:hypothetical protein